MVTTREGRFIAAALDVALLATYVTVSILAYQAGGALALGGFNFLVLCIFFFRGVR